MGLFYFSFILSELLPVLGLQDKFFGNILKYFATSCCKHEYVTTLKFNVMSELLLSSRNNYFEVNNK